MATHSSVLAWRILWAEKPGGLQLMTGSQRVGHNRVAKHKPLLYLLSCDLSHFLLAQLSLELRNRK